MILALVQDSLQREEEEEEEEKRNFRAVKTSGAHLKLKIETERERETEMRTREGGGAELRKHYVLCSLAGNAGYPVVSVLAREICGCLC